jgi:hypothetical protein
VTFEIARHTSRLTYDGDKALWAGDDDVSGGS